MKRLLASVTASVLAVSVLAACGGDAENASDEPSESASESPSKVAPSEEPSAGDAEGTGTRYCDLLGSDFATLFGNVQNAEDVNKALGVIDDIAAEAPDEVAADWKTMATALGEMRGSLTEAAQLQEQMQSGTITKEQFEQKTKELMKSMEGLDTKENNEAGDAVTKHIRDYCGVDFGQ